MAVLGGSNGSLNTTASLGYENPAFKIKIVPPNDNLQQKRGHPRPNPSDDAGDNIKEGDPITAKVGERRVTGTVYSVEKNDQGDVIFIEIRDLDGNLHKVDISRIRAAGVTSDDNPNSVQQGASSPGIFAESKFSDYETFVSKNSSQHILPFRSL